MKIYFDNNLYNLPSTQFLLDHEHLISKSYYVRKFYEEYDKVYSGNKPSLTIEQIFKTRPDLELKNLNYFNVINTKKTIFNELLPYLKKMKELPPVVANILAKYDFTEQEVLSQLSEAFEISLKDIKYRDSFFYYYANRELKQDIPWLQRIVKILLAGENRCLENYFEIMGISKHSEIIIDQRLLDKMLDSFPHLDTIEDNILCLSLINKQKMVSDEILEKVILFYNELSGPSYVDELKYYLKLTFADYVHLNYPMDKCKYFMGQLYLDYFDISVLKKVIKLKSENYNKVIAPLAKNNFIYFMNFHENNKAYTPLSELIANGFANLEKEKWDLSDEFAEYLASKKLKYDIQQDRFFRQIVLPKFRSGNDIVKSRLLPLFAQFNSNPEKYDEEVTKIEHQSLPDREQRYLFRYLNGKKISKKTFCYLISLTDEMIKRSQNCKKEFSIISNYGNLVFDTDINNFENPDFLCVAQLEKFVTHRKDFVKTKLNILDFSGHFKNLESYYNFLIKYFEIDVIANHFKYLMILNKIESKILFKSILELSDLHADDRLVMKDSDYMWFAANLESFSDWKELFSHAPDIQEYFKINHEFKEKLENM